MKNRFAIPDFVQVELDKFDAENAAKATTVLAPIQAEGGNIIQLFPLCASSKRLVPSSLLRSALFGVVQRGKRAYIKDCIISSQEGSSIKYTGERLMQSDQDVWMACIEACKRSGKTNVTIGQRELIKLAGRKGGDTKRLWNDIKRLSTAGIEVIDGKASYCGTLINEAYKDDETGHLHISINKNMLALFGGQITHIDIEQRKALKMDLSKWLHGFVCSHKSSAKNQSRISLGKLQELCGSTASIRESRRNIRAAADELKAMYILADWKLERDVLTYYKPPAIVKI